MSHNDCERARDQRNAKDFFTTRAVLAGLGVLVYRSDPSDAGGVRYFTIAGDRVRAHPDVRSLRELAHVLRVGGGH